MESNLKMSQSSKVKASVTPLFPAPSSLRASHGAKVSLAEAKAPVKRQFAWHVAPNLFTSFKYAWAGVRYAFMTQRNFRIHSAIAVLAVSLGFFLRVAAVEMGVVTLTCALVMVLELLNTALESVVDLTVGHAYHELAKIAKDCAAGAVLIAAIAAVFVASYILLPPLWALIL
jgi:diacylglycerol kinase (ATP)